MTQYLNNQVRTISAIGTEADHYDEESASS